MNCGFGIWSFAKAVIVWSLNLCNILLCNELSQKIWSMKVKLKPNKIRGKKRLHPLLHSLSPDKEYIVIGIEADDYRIVDDKKSPVLFPSCLFTIIDHEEPDDWVSEYGEDGERYAYAPGIGYSGFFEDYHDDDPEAISAFWEYMQKKGYLYS